MELDNRERYASAALFTLALHSSQVDNWVPAFIDVKMQKLRSGSSQSVMAAWGCPDPDGFPFEMQPDMETATFWGWDAVRARGLCQRVFRHLRIPERSWPALLSLPEVAGYPSTDIRGFVELVRTYVGLLDSSVAAPAPPEGAPVASDDLGAEAGLARTFTAGLETIMEANPCPEGEGPADSALPSELKAEILSRCLSGEDDPAPAGKADTDGSWQAFGEEVTPPPSPCRPGDAGVTPEQPSGMQPREFLSGCFSPGSDASGDELAAQLGAREMPGMGAGSSGNKVSAGEGTVSRRVTADGQLLVGDPLTEHVVEDHMPPAAEGASPASSSSPSPSKAAARAGVFSSLFRRYKKLDGSGDMEDINFELEREIADAQMHQANGGEGAAEGHLPGSSSQSDFMETGSGDSALPEAASSMPNFFKEHMQCARTDTPEVLSAVSHARPSPTDTSAEALGVVWELLTATLGVTLEEEVDDCPEDVLGSALEAGACGARAVDRVRWYDARSRSAIKIVAYWLRVPWRRVTNLEALLATTYMFPQPGETRKTRHWTSSRALKVGAAAIAGGGLLALTGGLAAPAIAMGLGAAWTVVGGTAAQAAAITGLASQAAIMGTMGTHGSYVFGKKMMSRTAQVSDFGFCMLDSLEDFERYEPEGGAAGGSEPSGSSLAAESEGGEAGDSSQTSSEEGHKASKWIKPFSWSSKAPKEQAMSRETGPQSTSQSEHRPSASVDNSSASVGSATKRSDSHRRGASAEAGGGEGKGGGSQWSWPSFRKAAPKLPTLPAPVNLKPDRCRLAVTIAVNGWVQKVEDFVDPWNVLDGSDCERYAIVWESNRLLRLGSALSTFVGTKVADQTAKWFMQHFWFSGLLAATAIPSLIVTSSAVIDNAWAVALNRAESAGKVLANVLMARAHGDRPVKLYGFSMGARLIFYCLLELYENGARGIVEDVVLLGTPISIKEARWAMARSVVSGRFVNGYSNRDWVLGVVYRSANAFTQQCGGLCAVKVHGVENVNLSSIIQGHTDYTAKLPTILEALNLTGTD